MVTVYDGVKESDDDKHAATGPFTASKYEYHGVNYVVTRFPKYSYRPPSVPISEIVGSVSGSDAKTILNSIAKKFKNSAKPYFSIHVVNFALKPIISYLLPDKYIFVKKFLDFKIIVVAP